MATTKKTSKTKRRSPVDAITLLKNDHREAEALFAKFHKAKSRKQEIALKVCKALAVHMILEEEIFYPAFLEATGEEDMHHEAEVEHDCAKKLMMTIEHMSPEDPYYSANVSVLAEMIKHHVHEEEMRGGMFAKAKSAEMDLRALGERMAQKKADVKAESTQAGDTSGKGQKAGDRPGPAALF